MVMDDLIERIQRVHERVKEERRLRLKAAADRQQLLDLCEAVAGWKPDDVLAFGGRGHDGEDVVTQLAWAFKEVARCVVRYGLDGRLKALADKGTPVRRYAYGLVRLAGLIGAGEELEERVRHVWIRPAVWLEVKPRLRKLPDMLWPTRELPAKARRGDAVVSPPRPSNPPLVSEGADETGEWLRPKEVAGFLGCSYGEARQRMLDGRIEAVKDRRMCRTRREWVEAYLERTKVIAAQTVSEVKARQTRRRREVTVPTGGVAEAFLRDRKG